MKKEIKRIFDSKMLIATLIAVVILPLIYGGLYLWAFWDPYGKMENLPVAVVNEDECARKTDKNDKKQYCFGQELIDKLKEEKSMNWSFVDRNEASTGLKNKKYYTMAVIPKDFSEKIISVDGNNPEKAEIEFRSRQASNFMASKFTDTAFVKIKAALNEKIAKEYFNNIFAKTRDSVKDLQKAAEGANDLDEGIEDAWQGGRDLYDGTDKLNSGIYDLRNGLGELYSGTEKLSVGASSAFGGVTQLNLGIKSLKLGLQSLNSGSSQMVAAVGGLGMGEGVVISQITAYIQAHPEASTSAELLTALGAANQVNGGINQLKSALESASVGGNQLLGGINSVSGGVDTLSVGISDIATGSASLKDNLAKAKDGSNELLNGVEKIKNGQGDLDDGLAKAATGAAELRDKLTKAVNETMTDTDKDKNEIQSGVMAAPVSIHDISIDIVQNNGAGFSPYFIPLALWVGAMAIFFLVDLEWDVKAGMKEFLPKLWVSLIVAMVQAGTLDLVLTKILGLTVRHEWSFIGFTWLLAICSTLIQMFLTLSLGLAGKFVGIVLLMLQLTSSAGSYPIETAPIFFQKVGPYLPMTYAVSALREIISGDNYQIINFDTKIILGYCLVFITVIGGYLLKKFKILSVVKINKWLKRVKRKRK